MRRLGWAALVLAGLAASGHAQVRTWDKLVGPGLSYRMEADFTKPLTVHSLRWTPAARTFRAEATLGGPVVLGDINGETRGREAVPAMALRTRAVAAINADFFPWTGDPLGFMLRAGDLISTPWPGRAVFAWGSGYAAMGRPEFRGTVLAPGGVRLPIAGVNQEAAGTEIVLNMPAAGEATLKEAGAHLVLKAEGRLPANGSLKATVEKLVEGQKAIKIEPGQAVLTASGEAAAELKKVAPGASLTLEVRTRGLDFKLAREAVGGGPVLVRAGKAVNEAAAEKFNDQFWQNRHPRTAIGRTAQGDILLVVVDGRQPGVSRGASLPEMADIMLRLGCLDAVNLDGGGSSELWLLGVTVNRPSDGVPRPVANGITVHGAAPFEPAGPGEEPAFFIQGRPRIGLGVFGQYRVVDRAGKLVDNTEIIWSAQGAGWIDQGGFLRGLKAGDAIVRAAVKGLVLEAKVAVEDPKAPKPEEVPPPVPPGAPPGTPPGAPPTTPPGR